MAGCYDVVLALIPLALVGITASLTGFGLGITTAIPLASLVAVGLIGHAMFVRTPGREDTATRSSFQPAD